MAKVLFINPVIREEDDPRHVPYGVALLASILMREGHPLGAHGRDPDEWRLSALHTSLGPYRHIT